MRRVQQPTVVCFDSTVAFAGRLSQTFRVPDAVPDKSNRCSAWRCVERRSAMQGILALAVTFRCRMDRGRATAADCCAIASSACSCRANQDNVPN
jgi:hypothetical protein